MASRAKQAADFKVNMTAVCKGVDDLWILCFSSAAFNVRNGGSSQGGYVVVLTSQRALQGLQRH